MIISNEILKARQSLPLEMKIEMTKYRIKEWYDAWDGDVFVSFSGGKDSTVLLDLVRSSYPEVPGVFADTGLEYPEIRSFVKKFDNITWVRPRIPFHKFVKDKGYPVVSKKVAKSIRTLQNPTPENANSRRLYWDGIKQDGTKTKWFKLAKKWRPLVDAPFKVTEKCCDVFKKNPIKDYQKEHGGHPYIGSMASDSKARKTSYMNTGCNNWTSKMSTPIAFWLEEDIWSYIKSRDLGYASVYDTGIDRTGCMFCMFGVHMERGENRFQIMKRTHPKQWDYCINKLDMGKILDFIKIPYK